MTPKQASLKIKQLLEALPKRKTAREKLSDVAFIRAMLEIIGEPLKLRKDKEAALAAKKQIIKRALKQFLTDLDKLYDRHDELGDTDVREQLTAAVHKSFILKPPGYVLPATFGMFSEEGNRAVRAALQKFIAHPETAAAARLLKSAEDRLGAFQDSGVKSTGGNTYFEYFGYTNKPRAA